ncbi:hypothetical protein SAMN05519103_09023 [Rhizobiales bacterium GAS113]|nr:hypothetical protein SAMN05519103_09023 [Rhizobiales bacterium GAS113]
MKRVGWSLAAAVAGLAALSPPEARGQDASFGCKVLLCAAASAPGWPGIPYCVPVMQSLFGQLAHGAAWPTCPEGNAGSLGYEPYLPCPSGMTAMQSGTGGSRDLVPSANGSLCADTSKPQQGCTGSGGDASCQPTYPTIARKARSEPNYVDIATANGTQRFYFSLKDY